MGSVFFLNCFTILSNFCFSWQEICPPQHPTAAPAHSVPVRWCWEQQQGPYSGPPTRGGGRRFHMLGWARPSRDTKVFCKPRHQWERTKEFQGSSSIFQSQTWAPGMPEDAPHSSDILSVCPHIACMVPTHQILLFMQLPEFPRPFNLAWMHNDCSVFNDTETFEHCNSRIPSCEH